MGRRALANPILGETPISTRDEASLMFRSVYFTGTLCTNGHLDWRYVSNGACRSCMKPPKPATPYIGEGPYKVMQWYRVRLPAMPRDQNDIRLLTGIFEREARRYMMTVGIIPWEKDDD